MGSDPGSGTTTKIQKYCSNILILGGHTFGLRSKNKLITLFIIDLWGQDITILVTRG